MKQTVSTILGALAGVLIWLAVRSTHPTASPFGWAVTGAWAGFGFYGLAFGQITLPGRGGKPHKPFSGRLARLIGCLMVVMAAGFVAWL